jgi:hypothetical protein
MAAEPGPALRSYLDALRDALALLAAVRAGDGEALIVLGRHMADPATTALILAGTLAEVCESTGTRIEVERQWREIVDL